MDFFKIRTPQNANNNTNTESANKKANENQPWVEKYRPKSMDDVASQEQTTLILKKALNSENLPHLLFYGPPGTGKTSTILALANELYGPRVVKSRVLELNASDERGIQIVRDKIKTFAKSNVTGSDDKYPCPPFKIIILDEADSMTKDAQSALRRTMETYSKTTRFCIICNYVSRIIEPIASRCAKFRFKSLAHDQLQQRIQMIATQENVHLGTGSLNALLRASNGDLRKAITYLQSGQSLQGQDEITPAIISEIAGTVPEDHITALMETASMGNVDGIRDKIQDIVDEGYSAENIVSEMHGRYVNDDSLTSLQKAQIAQFMAVVDIHLIQRADEQLQLLDLMVKISAVVVQ
ncbi:replication factor C subunit 2 [Backusella circina FSU 941]|nr:replication factor C subunit 2 [Backusella circina FSU 941]